MKQMLPLLLFHHKDNVQYQICFLKLFILILYLAKVMVCNVTLLSGIWPAVERIFDILRLYSCYTNPDILVNMLPAFYFLLYGEL